MAPWQSLERLLPMLPDHCTPEGQILRSVSSAFHVCIPTPLALLSTILGCLSILAWLFAQLPQIFKNYKLQSTAGLSIFFLVEWCLGDANNLAGALLTGQASWQVIVASYYVFVDVILVLQYFWYTHYKSWREETARLNIYHGTDRGPHHRHHPGNVDGALSANGTVGGEDDESATKPREVPFNAFRVPNFASSPREKGTPGSSQPRMKHVIHNTSVSGPSPKTVLFLAMLCAVLGNASPLYNPVAIDANATPSESESEFLGRIFSWTSTLLYLGSRIPQIYKNQTRRSTAGLSPSLFIAAFFGNLFYSTSLLTNPLAWESYPPYGGHGWAGPKGSDRATWLTLAAPFWLGAAGVLALDAAVGVQFLKFGEEGKRFVRIIDSRGRSHWRSVSGWMRGWVPSPSPERRSTGTERPLLENEESGDGGRGYGAI